MAPSSTPEPLNPAYVSRAARTLDLLSHEIRLQVVLLLAVLREAHVSALADALDTSQSNLSHHLRLLRDSGLVEDRREGQFVMYSLAVSAWRELADGFFDSLLEGEDTVTLQNFRIERLPRKEQ